MEKLIWIDCETTGLDPVHDQVLEVSYFLTCENLTWGTSRTFLAPRMLGSAPIHIRDYRVVKMHADSGLLEELAKRPLSPDDAWAMLDDRAFMDVVSSGHAGCALAGSNPSFDRQFLQKYMPRFLSAVSHRHFDVSTLRIMFPDVYEQFKKEERISTVRPHRAEDDILQDLSFTSRVVEFLTNP